MTYYPQSGTIGNRDNIGGLEWCKEGMTCIRFARDGWCYFPRQKGLDKPKVGCPILTFRHDEYNLYPTFKLRTRIITRLAQFRKETWRFGFRIKYVLIYGV